MQRDGVAPVARAEPQVVGGDGPYLAHRQRSDEPGGDGTQRLYGVGGGISRQEVLRLQFLAVAGREVGAEVGQPLMPPAHLAKLRGRGRSVEPRYRMLRSVCEWGAEPVPLG